jgi:hydroxymethylglutaryl-CoA reductase
MLKGSSSLSSFRSLSLDQRRLRIAELAGLDPVALSLALESGGLDAEGADQMVENALGTLALPFGVGLHFRINGRDFLAPMVVEEPSVIAAASHAAKRIRAGGGFVAEVDASVMIAQVEVHGVGDAASALARLRSAESELVAAANRAIPSLVERGGGARASPCAISARASW